jgi:hypothetical protein
MDAVMAGYLMQTFLQKLLSEVVLTRYDAQRLWFQVRVEARNRKRAGSSILICVGGFHSLVWTGFDAGMPTAMQTELKSIFWITAHLPLII